MSSHTSTCRTKPRHVAGREEQVGSERHLPTGEGQHGPYVVARREVPSLVELPVRRQVRLRRHPEDLASVQHDRAVVDAVAPGEGGAHDDHRRKLGGGLGEAGQRGCDALQEA
jgi:hypothetical protein